MTKSIRLAQILLPALSLVLVGCVSRGALPPQRSVERTPTHAPKKSILPKPGEKVSTQQSSGKVNQTELLHRLLVYNPQLEEEETLDWLQLLKKEEKNSLEKAVVYLGVISKVSIPEQNSMNLEQQLHTINLDITALLQHNPYLQPISVADRTINYLKETDDSPEFKRQVLQVFEAKAQSWTQLWKTVINSGDTLPQIQQQPESIAEVEPLTLKITHVPPESYHAADLLLGDSILLKAKKLAEKGSYKLAIRQANMVPQADPFFPEAQEKIKYFSNLAVQDLRQKAAKAFQSSLPVHDFKTKTAYLEAAKKYLEEALTDYPAADHLKTVQENLAVITRDLTNIKDQNQY